MITKSYLFVVTPLLASVLAWVLIPSLRKLANYIGLVDHPNFRKVHAKSVPLVGGIAVFLSANLAILASLFFDQSVRSLELMFVLALILLVMGAIDDRKDMRAWHKLVIQLILAQVVFLSGIRIESLHGLFGIYELAPWIQNIVTVMVIAGVVNAFNLMDGIDGLAAGMAIAGLALFTVLSFLTGQYQLALVFLTFIGSLLSFLRYNFSRKKKIFMGDAGSLVLGFIMVVGGVQLLQSATQSNYEMIVLIGIIAVLMLPVLDAVRVFRIRIMAGKSPFTPDKNHLHHLVLALGFKHALATVTIVGISLLHVLVGYFAFVFAGPTVAVLSMILLFISIVHVLSIQSATMEAKQCLKEVKTAQE